MEFIIVAPLYFLLLGGLFLVGGMMLNRMRMHVGDHLVTWIGGSRFCPREGGGTADDVGVSEKSMEGVEDLTAQLFDCPVGGLTLQEEHFHVLCDHENQTRINHFMAFYYGGITALPLDVPPWIRGMLGVQGAMAGDGTSEWFLMDTAEYDCGSFRSYSFHRLPLQGIDNDLDPSGDVMSRSKKISAFQVAMCGYLDAVLGDRWIEDESASPSVDAEVKTVSDIPEGRTLGRFGE